MFDLYYCLDRGLTVKIKEDFLENYSNCLYINCHNYETLFQKLQQNNLFVSYDAYLIDNASFLSLQWRNMATRNETLDFNNKKIKSFFKILESFKKNKINVLILVYSGMLLNNKYIKNLLTIFDNLDFKIEVLNNKTKIQYIDSCVEKQKINLDEKAKIYLYNFFPKNAEFINEVFKKIELLNCKKISFNDLQRLVGNFREFDYFLLIDYWLDSNFIWIEIFNHKCVSHKDAHSLLNICIFKISELYHFIQLKNKGFKMHEIAKIMQKIPFMLIAYNKIYENHYRKINDKLIKIIVKLYRYLVNNNKNQSITILNLKKILLSF